MVLLFTHQNSPRLHYILEEILLRRLGFAVSITTNWEEFLNNPTVHKIAYTPTPIGINDNDSVIWVFSNGLLQENFIRPIQEKPAYQNYSITVKNEVNPLPFNTLFGLFPEERLASTVSNESQSVTSDEVLFVDLTSKIIPFDLFATVFWSLSRYEEVQWGISQSNNEHHSTNQPDQHGRYPAAQSLFSQCGVLERPFVDELVWFLGAFFHRKPTYQHRVIPTADIDMALRYGGRSFYTQIASALRDVFKNPSLISERLRVLFGGKDPYSMDNGAIQILQKQEGLTSILGPKLFLLASNQRTQRNKQINKKALTQEFQRLKKHFATNNDWIGIHPSWQEKSNALNNLTEWKKEMADVESIIDQKPKHARFHYIHLHIPHSYRLLNQLGITTDWSMGYPEAVGFRAGSAVPFVWYDVLLEQPTEITVVPFCIMDVTCKNYLNLSQEESIHLGELIKSKVSSLGGLFCFIFHNESVSESHPWREWKNVVESWARPLKKNQT